MIADFFTKSLQGISFRMFRYLIMGYNTIYRIIQALNNNNLSFPIKERDENFDMSKNGEIMFGNNPLTNREEILLNSSKVF